MFKKTVSVEFETHLEEYEGVSQIVALIHAPKESMLYKRASRQFTQEFKGAWVASIEDCGQYMSIPLHPFQKRGIKTYIDVEISHHFPYLEEKHKSFLGRIKYFLWWNFVATDFDQMVIRRDKLNG